jgi:hypothetical protein
VLLVALSVGLTCNFDPALACPPQTQTENKIQPNLHITVLQGEDGVNILKKKMAVKPVIEVRDKNNLPVADASVTFAAPESGPSVAFAHGSHIFMTTTGANGRAMVAIMKPVGTGAFRISVTAALHGQVVTAAIAQTNYLTMAAAGAAGAGAGAGAAGAGAGAGGAAAAAGISATTIGIVAAGVAAAVGVGVAVAKGGGSKTTTTAPAQGTIGSGGSPVIGPPH